MNKEVFFFYTTEIEEIMIVCLEKKQKNFFLNSISRFQVLYEHCLIYLVNIEILSIFNAELGESKATVHKTCVCPL